MLTNTVPGRYRVVNVPCLLHDLGQRAMGTWLQPSEACPPDERGQTNHALQTLPPRKRCCLQHDHHREVQDHSHEPAILARVKPLVLHLFAHSAAQLKLSINNKSVRKTKILRKAQQRQKTVAQSEKAAFQQRKRNLADVSAWLLCDPLDPRMAQDLRRRPSKFESLVNGRSFAWFFSSSRSYTKSNSSRNLKNKQF